VNGNTRECDSQGSGTASIDRISAFWTGHFYACHGIAREQIKKKSGEHLMQQSPARSEPSQFTPKAPGAYEHLPGTMKTEKSMIEHGVGVIVPFSAMIKFRWHNQKIAGSPAGVPVALRRMFDRQGSATNGYGGAA